MIAESKRVANQCREQLRKDVRYSWILDDLLLPSTVQSESEDTPFHATLKVWNVANVDENGNPQCIRTVQLFHQMEEECITCFAVSEENDLFLFGCRNGRVFFYQGDALRSSHSMMNLFPPSLSDAVTNLFVTYDPDVRLFPSLHRRSRRRWSSSCPR